MTNEEIAQNVRFLQAQAKRADSLRGKIRWHVARAGSGGSWKAAEDYQRMLDSTLAEMRRVHALTKKEAAAKRNGIRTLNESEDALDSIARLLIDRTEVTRDSLTAWSAKYDKDPLLGLRRMVVAADTYGMGEWRGKDFRESVVDWFWDGLEPTRTMGKRRCLDRLVEFHRDNLDKGTSLEEMLSELEMADEEKEDEDDG